ncbi:MAG: hypothetical protein CME65_15640 [Halobacteriovoraceae bacterium]|nr:hypothetical protein [Halobacteriovoraceae bacterium]|tara:strand:+ start:1027 stop:1836 length:810 start_codon:yes stop_codon:yes gene_type:complete
MIYEKSLPAMGSSFIYQILLKNGIKESAAENAVEKAHGEVLKIQNRYSEFDENSFLSQINRSAGYSSLKISMDDYILFKKSLDFGNLSKGVFDIAFRSQAFSYKDIKLNDQEIFLPYKGMKISLGGIGKGHAVDCAYQKLKQLGMENFMVNGSGDIRVHTLKNALRPWNIGIKNPFNMKKFIGKIPLVKGAIASSGNYIQQNHIQCLNDSLKGVTVIDRDATSADVWGTSLFRMGLDRAIETIKKYDLNAVLIDRSGRVHNFINQEVIA